MAKKLKRPSQSNLDKALTMLDGGKSLDDIRREHPSLKAACNFIDTHGRAAATGAAGGEQPTVSSSPLGTKPSCV